MRGRRAVFGIHSTILATAYTPLPSCAPCLVAAIQDRQECQRMQTSALRSMFVIYCSQVSKVR